MDVIKIEIPNLLILEPKVFGDSYSWRSVLRGSLSDPITAG
jgi:hypothetical protein